MIDYHSIEPLVRQYVPFQKQTLKGWNTCKCNFCKDYKVRAGFKFDMDITSYHCFNCGMSTLYDPTYKQIPPKMKTVLDSYGVPEYEYNQVVFNNYKLYGLSSHSSEKRVIDPDTTPVYIDFPTYFTPLIESDDEWSIKAIEYLKTRHIQFDQYPFHIMVHEKQDSEIENKWRGRLIIPYYRNHKVVWYQGRDLKENSKLRYLNGESSSECILSNYDSLYIRSTSPLYITEGFFDSVLINGVAIFGNTFKRGQIKLLNSSAREKVYIPDNTKDGQQAALQAIENNWKVSLPVIGSSKDINSAISRYGKLYVMKTLYDNICEGQNAVLKIKMYGR